MAALEPPVEGLPTAPIRSFAEVLSSPNAPKNPPLHRTILPSHACELSFDDAEISSHKGFPSLIFDDKHVASLSQSFPWTLIGKFSHGYNKADPKRGRPSVEELEKYFSTLDLKTDFSIGLLDNRHLLIRLTSEQDYLRIYSRTVWYVAKVTMRVFKWTPYFNVDRETSLAPVWVSFPRLPVIFFNRFALFRIAVLLGTPLRLDAATNSLKRPSVARLQIEIDLLKERPSQIWIGMGSVTGFWQKVEYDYVPDYCTHCWHVGHKEILCTIHNPELKLVGRDVQAQPQPRKEYKRKQQLVPEAKDSGKTPDLVASAVPVTTSKGNLPTASEVPITDGQDMEGGDRTTASMGIDPIEYTAGGDQTQQEEIGGKGSMQTAKDVSLEDNSTQAQADPVKAVGEQMREADQSDTVQESGTLDLIIVPFVQEDELANSTVLDKVSLTRGFRSLSDNDENDHFGTEYPFLLPTQICDDYGKRYARRREQAQSKPREVLIKELRDFANSLIKHKDCSGNHGLDSANQCDDATSAQMVEKRKRGRPPKHPVPMLQPAKTKAAHRSIAHLSKDV